MGAPIDDGTCRPRSPRILVPLLVGYVVLLVVAAWRHEVRPAVFDRATDFARGALGLAGISPGIAVFTADSGSAPDEKVAAICLEVRSVSEDSEDAGRQVYPAEDVFCPAPSPRLWVRGEQIFLHQSVVSLRAAVAAHRGGDADASRGRFAMLLARSIGAHFLGRDRRAGAATDRYLLLWREARISYRTRSRSHRVVALMNWRRASAPRVFIAWQPDEEMLRERGWGPAEP